MTEPQKVEFPLRPNRLKLTPGQRPNFILMNVPSVDLLEVYGMLGEHNSFMIEGEHAPYDEREFLQMVRIGELYNMTPGIRMETLERGQICRLLDFGIQWMHHTHVKDGKDAGNLVKYAKFYPEGERGWGQFARIASYGLADEAEALKVANDYIYLSVAIEDMEGVENAEQICAVEGIDWVTVGPSDLSASMGLPGQYGHPKVKAVFEELGRVFAKHAHATMMPAYVPQPGQKRPSFTLARILQDKYLERRGG